MIWLSALWARVWPYIAAAGAILAGLFAVRQSGKAAGRQEVQAKQNEETIKAMEAAREAHAEIDALDDDAVRDRARQRMRRNQGR